MSTRMSVSTLDPLRKKRAEVEQALLEAKASQADAQREISRLSAEARRLDGAIEAGECIDLAVSEHALLRYAERVLGLDTSEVVRAIEHAVAPAATILGDGTYPLTPGLVAVVKGRTVVTIKPA
jgi:hypothetical protein